jgi:SAM-dependent methyltransferase
MRDTLEQTIEVYERTADGYKTRWTGYTTEALATFAKTVGVGVVLDAGCGPGRDLAALEAAGVNAVGVDLSPAMVAIAVSEGHRAAIGDLCDLSFPDSTFCGIWASASLVHLSYDEAHRALEELHRVTAPGGIAHVTVKAKTGDRYSTGFEGEGEHARWFRYWTCSEFEDLTGLTGWTVERIGLNPDSAREGLYWVTADLTRP